MIALVVLGAVAGALCCTALVQSLATMFDRSHEGSTHR